jgi:hypothetical protein
MRRESRRVDVVALVFGLLLTGCAAGALWYSVVGGLEWRMLRIAVPLILVIIGLLGLVASRNHE